LVFRLLTAALAFLAPLMAAADDFHDYRGLTAAQVNAITSTSTRTVIDLSGPWDLVEDDEVTGTQSIPSTLERGRGFTVRRSVKMDKTALQSRAWHLWFLGVSDEVDLIVNGRFVMKYPGGSAPFMARIPDNVLREGSNLIEISVADRGDLAMLVSRFAPAAPRVRRGILREVFLIGTPLVWTSDLAIKQAFTAGNSRATVSVTATIKGSSVDRLAGSTSPDEALRQGSVVMNAEAVIKDRSGVVVARSGPVAVTIERSRTVRQRFTLDVSNPQLWSPTKPDLYDLQIELTHQGRQVDLFQQSLGLRSARIGTINQQRAFVLNDQQMFLNAVDYIEEYPRSGRTMSWLQMEHDVSLLKTLGVNAVRFSTAAPHPYLLHLCDRYGLLAFTEIEANGIPKRLLLAEEIWALMSNRVDMLTNYIGTHPSVVAVGLSDMLEEGTDQTNTFHTKLAEVVRSRTSALVYKTVAGTSIGKTSEGGFDLIILRADSRTAREHLDGILSASQRVIRQAAVMISVGSLVSPANTNGFSDPLSNESQAVVIREGYRAAQNHHLAGVVVSSFNDHFLEFPTMLVDHDDAYVRTSGLVDMWREQRVSYAMYKALINDEKEPLLQAREYDDATPLVFIGTGIVLALVLTFLVNRSRRFREYFLRSIVRPYNFYADIRDQRILSLVQTVILGLVIAYSAGLVVAALGYYLRSDPAFEYLTHITLPSSAVIELVRSIVWHPPMAILIVGSLVFLTMAGATLLLRVGSIFAKGRILFRDTFTIVVWSAVPLLALLPIGIGLYQVLSTDTASVWIPTIITVAGLWTLVRTLRATSVVFDVSPMIVYLLGTLTVATILGLGITFWAVQAEGFAFLQYYGAVVRL